MKRQRTALLIALAVSVLALAAAIAQGPGATQATPDRPGRPGGPPPPPTVAVGPEGVYVVAGPNIVRLNAKTLAVEATGELPRPPKPKPGDDQPHE